MNLASPLKGIAGAPNRPRPKTAPKPAATSPVKKKFPGQPASGGGNTRKSFPGGPAATPSPRRRPK